VNGTIQEFFQASLYKRSQGRIARQATLGALVVTIGFGLYRLHETFVGMNVESVSGATWLAISYGVPLVLFLLCGWIAFRLVHLPRFADFLIAVEAEMNKVSWPSRGELIRSSIVVLVCILVLAVVLTMYDQIWFLLFKWLGVLGQAKQQAG
jgi:preprotein translocase subunit SecE